MNRTVLGIAGGTGSGKTYAAKSLLNDDKVKELYLGISKEGRKNFRDVLKEESKKKSKKKVN